MSTAKRQWRNLLPVYVAGAAKSGWCCATCHRPFDHQHKPARIFGRLVMHRLLSHRLVRFLRPTGEFCHITHAGAKPQFIWTAPTQTWTAVGTITFPAAPVPRTGNPTQGGADD